MGPQFKTFDVPRRLDEHWDDDFASERGIAIIIDGPNILYGQYDDPCARKGLMRAKIPNDGSCGRIRRVGEGRAGSGPIAGVLRSRIGFLSYRKIPRCVLRLGC